jgi:hypothetical protein
MNTSKQKLNNKEPKAVKTGWSMKPSFSRDSSYESALSAIGGYGATSQHMTVSYFITRKEITQASQCEKKTD